MVDSTFWSNWGLSPIVFSFLFFTNTWHMSGERFNFTEDQLQQLKTECAEWSRYNGLVMRNKSAAMTLTPGRFALK